MVKLQVHASNTGLGVFAYSTIKEGEVVQVMKGKLMTTDEVEQAIDEKKINADDPFQIAEEEFIKLNKLPYLFNHSCDPNAGINSKIELVALRYIEKRGGNYLRLLNHSMHPFFLEYELCLRLKNMSQKNQKHCHRSKETTRFL